MTGIFDAADNPRWKLLEAAEAQLSRADTREAVLAVIRKTARSVLGADGITVVLREGALCHYAEEDAISPLWKGQRFPLQACISGWAMLHAQTAVIEDIYADPRIPHAAYRPTFVKSLIMTPVSDREPVAAIGAYWRERQRFSDREVMAAKTLAFAVGRVLTDAM